MLVRWEDLDAPGCWPFTISPPLLRPDNVVEFQGEQYYFSKHCGLLHDLDRVVTKSGRQYSGAIVSAFALPATFALFHQFAQLSSDATQIEIVFASFYATNLQVRAGPRRLAGESATTLSGNGRQPVSG